MRNNAKSVYDEFALEVNNLSVAYENNLIIENMWCVSRIIFVPLQSGKEWINLNLLII